MPAWQCVCTCGSRLALACILAVATLVSASGAAAAASAAAAGAAGALLICSPHLCSSSLLPVCDQIGGYSEFEEMINDVREECQAAASAFMELPQVCI